MTSMHNPPRTGSLWCQITNAAGITCRYRLVPVGHAPGDLAAYQLVKLDQLGRERARYRCTLLGTGATDCTCPVGAAGGPCKHADFLKAAGLFPAALLRQLRELVEDLEGRQHQLSALTSQGPKVTKPRRPRARKEAANDAA